MRKKLQMYLKSEFIESAKRLGTPLNHETVLKSPVTTLVGVNDIVASILRQIQINTVFDLANSSIFRGAEMLLQTSDQSSTALSRMNIAPFGVVKEGDIRRILSEGRTVSKLANESTLILQGVDQQVSEFLSEQMNVETVADLVKWPIYQAARSIFDSLVGESHETMVDKEEAISEAMQPKFGEIPSEEHYYSHLVLDHVQPKQGLKSIVEEGGFNLDDLIDAKNEGVKGIGFGAHVQMKQEWIHAGTSYGELIESKSLAAGESMKEASVDWQREGREKLDEMLRERDKILNTIKSMRSINEVVNAVASDSQSGYARSWGESLSEMDSKGSGGKSLPGVGSAKNESSGATSVSGSSFSSSRGKRQVSSDMTQNINDKTQQSAASLRQRSAFANKRLLQIERSTAVTDVIANYNRRHSLNLMFYLLMQNYKIRTQVHKVDPCLFVPVKPPNFKSPKTRGLILHNRGVLMRAALSDEVRHLLRGYEKEVLINPAPPVVRGGEAIDPVFDSVSRRFVPDWVKADAYGIKKRFGKPILGATKKGQLSIPRDAQIVGITAASDVAQLVSFRRSDDLRGHEIYSPDARAVALEHPISVQDISSLVIDNPKDEDMEEEITLHMKKEGQLFDFTIPTKLKAKQQSHVLQFAPAADVDLVNHLEENSWHYAQAMYEALDEVSATLLLSGYVYDGSPLIPSHEPVPLLEVVDAKPIRLVGNMLVFKMNPEYSDKFMLSWNTWLMSHGIDLLQPIVKESLISVPSNVTFMEAVLGRVDCAEKLDITRFTHWHENPIPHQATDIQPPSTDSRAQAPTVDAPQMSPPIISISAAPNLPAPVSFAGAYNVLNNPNLFRDMSGLPQLMTLLGYTGQFSSANAQAAAELTGRLHAQGVDYAGLAVQAMSMLMGGGMSAPKTQTEKGEMINQGQKMDKKAGLSAPSGGSSGSAIGGQQEGVYLPPGQGGASYAPTTTAMSREDAAFRQAAYGPLGMSGAELLGAGGSGLFSGSSAASAMPVAAASMSAIQASPTTFLRSQNSAGWRDLFLHKPSSALIAKMRQRFPGAPDAVGICKPFQLVGDGRSPVNMDYYPISIDQLPVLPGKSKVATVKQLYDYVRMHINDFVDNSNSEFAPYNTSGRNNDQRLWLSSNPLNAVISIRIHLPVGGTDDATVATSEYADNYWRFSTMWADRNAYHPVSGTREFGYFTQSNRVIFYTRGVDRFTGKHSLGVTVPNPFSNFSAVYMQAFNGSDALWKSLQTRLVDFIKSHGGSAMILPSEQEIVDYKQAVEAFGQPAYTVENTVDEEAGSYARLSTV